MQIPITMMTDKVMSMIKSMVVLAMRVSYRRGATAEDISVFLREWTPGDEGIYHVGLVERALFDLEVDGAVKRAGARWYPVGLVA